MGKFAGRADANLIVLIATATIEDTERHMQETKQQDWPGQDRLLTFHEAAAALCLPYFKIQRAAKGGLIPTYSLFNSRKYVKLTDILVRLSAEQK